MLSYIFASSGKEVVKRYCSDVDDPGCKSYLNGTVCFCDSERCNDERMDFTDSDVYLAASVSPVISVDVILLFIVIVAQLPKNKMPLCL